LDEGNGLILAELTLAHLALGDAATARLYLRLAEQRATSAPPEVFGVLGDVYERLHRLDDAAAAWEEFARFGGQDPAVLARLRRARDELAVARGQRSRDAPPFRIELKRGAQPRKVLNQLFKYTALQSTFGALYVNDFNRDGRVFRVHLQSDSQFRSRPDDIRDVYVRGEGHAGGVRRFLVAVHE